MPVVIAFTLTALLAMVVNSWFLVRSFRKRKALRELVSRGEVPPDEAPDLNRVAAAFVQIWIAILAVDIILVIAGIGILEGDGRVFGYLLSVVPAAHVIYGVIALRSFADRSS